MDQESRIINELTTDLLAKYKKAAGQDATRADQIGDTARANKRFSGIVKATKKQFDNDLRKHKTDESRKTDNFTAADITKLSQLPDLEQMKTAAIDLIQTKSVRQIKPEKVSYFIDVINQSTNKNSIIKLMYDLLLSGEGNSVIGSRNSMKKNSYRDRFGEGSMGGINRSRPGADVSYERVLDDDDEIYQSVCEMWQKEKLEELSVGKLNDYLDSAKNPDTVRRRSLLKLAKSADGVQKAVQRINTKTGHRPGNNQDPRGTNEDIGKIVRDQNKDKKDKGPRKVVEIKHNGWLIKYRSASRPGDIVLWVVYDHKGNKGTSGEAPSDEEAVSQAKFWINHGAGQNKTATGNATIDFNGSFSREYAPNGEILYVNIIDGYLLMSRSPGDGLKKTNHRIAGSVIFQSVTLTPKEIKDANLVANGRYVLGDGGDFDVDIKMYPLEFVNMVQDKNDRYNLGKPGFTVASLRNPNSGDSPETGNNTSANEDYEGPWRGDPKKIAKAPKSSLLGSPELPLSELIKDTIDTHGIKFAFEFYVKKHGLPPRQFQILAGLTADKPTKDIPSWQKPAPVRFNKPTKQSLWRRIVDRFLEEDNNDPCWKNYRQIGMKVKGGKKVPNCVPVNENEYTLEGDQFVGIYEDESLFEAEYQGRTVTLNKPMQGDVKKFKVYVKDPSTGNVKKVNFGDPDMKIRKSNSAARKSFRARHNCDNPGPKTKARYWSCKKW